MEKPSTSGQSLIEIKDAGQKDYLNIPARDLLDAFGQGSHIPGSGSAAAFSGLMAIEMMRTVLQLTIPKKGYEKSRPEFEQMLESLTTESKPKFINFFNTDISVFHKVSYHRRLRDKAQSEAEKSHHSSLSLESLREATSIPLEICQNALDLLPIAFSIFDNGFQSARGDAGVAISNLLSSAQGSLFIVFLNLKTFQKSKWKDEKIAAAVELARKFTKLQKDAYSRVIKLYNENSDSQQLTLDFYREENLDSNSNIELQVNILASNTDRETILD